jgi:hypothetical protein
MNTYYHSDTGAEVEAIVRDGFIPFDSLCSYK